MKTKIKAKKGILLYCLIAVVSLASILYFDTPIQDSKNLQTSLLSMVQTINEKIPGVINPDLSIENVHLKKTADPTDDFPYYKYSATVVLHNYGGAMKDNSVVLHAGADQKYTFVRNEPDGFTLAHDESYIASNYEVIFDGKYNGGKISFGVDIKDANDSDLKNNEYVVEVFELPAKLENVRLKNNEKTGAVELDFDNDEFNSENYERIIFVSNGEEIQDVEFEYKELYTKDGIVSYYTLENSKGKIDNIDWEEREPEYERYLYLMLVDRFNGNYAVSDIVYFSNQDSLTRSEFAKLFVEEVGERASANGVNTFEDVDENELYAPYVQTLYELGLTDDQSPKFKPSKIISRAEVLAYVFNYYDMDLQIEDGAPHFIDVDGGHQYFDYAESLYTSGRAQVLRGYLNPDDYATKDYLKYLINECRKSN